MTCREFGLAVDTVEDWRKTDVEFETALQEARSHLNEQVEGGLVEQALKPDGPPVSKIFYLKNNWKEKYGEHYEVEVAPSQLWFQRPAVIDGEVVDRKQLEAEE